MGHVPEMQRNRILGRLWRQAPGAEMVMVGILSWRLRAITRESLDGPKR
jgi:hypothetical protein